MPTNEKKKTNAELVQETEQLTTQVQQLQATCQEMQGYIQVVERANAKLAQDIANGAKEGAAFQIRSEMLENQVRMLQAQAPQEGEAVDGVPDLKVVEGSGDSSSADSPSEQEV